MYQFLTQRLGRRDLFRGGAFAALPGLFSRRLSAAPNVGLRLGADIYQSIGVRPLINARGTFTIISGSLMLPEVRAAMAEASQHHVQIDELMDAVGARLAELTKAEWGMVSCGCSAALTHATAACVAGGNPDLHVRIPDLRGFSKDEVIIPKHSRNVYDAAVRSVGAKVVEAGTAEELEAAFGPRTAMVYILAGPQADEGALSTRAIAQLAKQKNVPVLVDAAAEILTFPNVHLEAGATLVAYSGGKCIRGPQTAGLLLGRKDLVRAAWVHSSPHHGYARSMKIGKEEAIGMLMAVEMWMKRDHKAEWSQWMARLDHVAKRLAAVQGVTTSVHEPSGLSNRTPSLAIRWDPEKLGITGAAVARHLLTTEPRIALPTGGGGRGGGSGSDTGVSVVPYMLSPGDEKTVADRLCVVLSNPPRQEPARSDPPAADLTGRWDVHIDYLASTSSHVLHLKQQGGRIEGTHQGDFVSRDLGGTIQGEQVRLSSAYTERHGDSLMFQFSGQFSQKVSGDEIGGTLDMGEYLQARWTAKRHQFQNRRG
jgi:L-seryl-tRNA(Ser) seleniumtransferase